MNILALYLNTGGPQGLIWTLVGLGIVIWLVFFVIPLPQIVRTILGIIIAVALVLMFLPGCAAYQKTVESRRISGGYNADGTFGFSDKVVYRPK